MTTPQPPVQALPAPPAGYFDPTWVGWTLVNCPPTPDGQLLPNWVDSPRLASPEVRVVPWLVLENRPLLDGMRLEVRLDVSSWLPVRVHLEHRADQPRFYVVAPIYGLDELAIDIAPERVELRFAGSEGAPECTSP